MMTRCHHQSVPLVILVGGTACVGKSTIATQLAQRLNLANVLQTEMVYELLCMSTEAPLKSSQVWTRDNSSSEELMTEFCRESRIIWKGLAGDLRKATKDGKPIIIEAEIPPLHLLLWITGHLILFSFHWSSSSDFKMSALFPWVLLLSFADGSRSLTQRSSLGGAEAKCTGSSVPSHITSE